MGESACLMQTFSHTSDTSNGIKQGDPIRALGESISFGRFMAESLSWEKWSSFSHNRYLEEVERYSKPGSVAQKKAYFEAHYKRIAAAKKAAALLEQEEAAAEHVTEPETEERVHNTINAELEQEGSNIWVDADESEEVKASNTDEPKEVVGANGFICGVEMDESGSSTKVEAADPVIKERVLVENNNKITETLMDSFPANQEPMALTSKKKPMISSSNSSVYSTTSKHPSSSPKPTTAHPRKENNATPNSKKSARNLVENKRSSPRSLHMSINAGKINEIMSPDLQKIGDSGIQARSSKTSKDYSTTPLRTPTRESCNANQEPMALTSKMKPMVSFSKSSVYNRTSKHQSSSTKPITPVYPRKDYNATPNGKKTARDLVEKKRSSPKSLHMSIHFTAAGEINEITSPALQKTGDSGVRAGSSKTIPIRTPTRASVNGGVPKHLSITPRSENKRSKTSLDCSISESRIMGEKWKSLSVDRSKSSSSCRSKPPSPSPTVFSPFSFRSDERAAKWRERLEKKFNVEEDQKMQQQTKSKEKAENELKKLRQSLGFKAKPMPSFYQETESPKNKIKKIPLMRPRSPKLGKKPSPGTIQDTSSLPPRTPSAKIGESKHVMKKNSRAQTHTFTMLPKKDSHENYSPNIQP